MNMMKKSTPLIVMLLFSVLLLTAYRSEISAASAENTEPLTGTEDQADSSDMVPAVYFTSDISPEGLIRIY